ncbi:hypothetical protein LPB260_20740 [Pseudomonas sp. LPB0260]|uniref:hypothetical protein n=1 Tax=Pseudomonas sp. LPB0260 TaxID=2614442 RepID=UPI0015C1F63A|nr:hypothetical protein [Pseudomonas sp. LPB0260]QLC73180.1 hypothetical protein LPB260_05790 [Pseudomonas sp. LPB0260]QLC75954.1 hypothetical protein LPB260_20740 [Pseudomonas sp. LPB0260]
MRKISELFILAFLPTVAIGGEVDYSKIAEASSARIGDTLVRYSRLYEEPCAYIQIINPKNWQATETARICEFNGLSFATEVADAYFSNPEFSKNGVHLQLSITPLEPTGEQNKRCFVPIQNKHIGTLECIDSN